MKKIILWMIVFLFLATVSMSEPAIYKDDSIIEYYGCSNLPELTGDYIFYDDFDDSNLNMTFHKPEVSANASAYWTVTRGKVNITNNIAYMSHTTDDVVMRYPKFVENETNYTVAYMLNCSDNLTVGDETGFQFTNGSFISQYAGAGLLKNPVGAFSNAWTENATEVKGYNYTSESWALLEIVHDPIMNKFCTYVNETLLDCSIVLNTPQAIQIRYGRLRECRMNDLIAFQGTGIYDCPSRYYIGECGTYTNTSTLNITFRDESDDNYVNASKVKIYLKIWEIESSNYNEMSINYSNVDDIELCIYPPYTNYTTDIIMQYEQTGYKTRDWIKNSYNLNNDTTYETIYFITTTNATAITMHITDAAGNEFEDILVEAWYFDLDDSTYKLVETKTTNTEGEAVFNLIQFNSYYQFKFYEGTKLRKETDKFQITATDLYFQISVAEVTRLDRLIQLRQLSTTLTYTNDTRGVVYSWGTFPTIVNKICWNVTYGNGTSKKAECTTLESSSFTYTLPDENVTFLINGYIYDTTGARWARDKLIVDLRDVWRRIWRQEGIFLGLLVFLVLSLVAVAHPIGGIVGACFAFVVIHLFGLMPIGQTWVWGILFLGVLLIVVMRKKTYYET